MRHTISLLLVAITVLSCGQSNKGAARKVPSENPVPVAYFDTIRKVYYNYAHKVSFDAPDHWLCYYGAMERKPFIAYTPDSTIIFTLDVKMLKEPLDLWEYYYSEKEGLKHSYKKMIRGRLEIPVHSSVSGLKKFLPNLASFKNRKT